MTEFSSLIPTRIVGGLGKSCLVSEIFPIANKKILFVCPENISDLAKACKRNLVENGAKVLELNPERPEPTIDEIDDAAADLRHTDIDLLIGFGGGSAMDLAKALAIALANPEPIWMYTNTSDKPPVPMIATPLPVITIPTTAGTGSEVTPYAVLSKTDTQQKGTIQDPSIFPSLAVLDGALMVDTPPVLTAATGLDAFAHALEATLNVSRPAPMAELFGKEAMRRVFKFLPKVLQSPSDALFRQEMALTAALAGLAISHRGTTAAHAIAEPLGAITHIGHGQAVSLATMPVLRATVASAPQLVASLWQLVDGKNDSAPDTEGDAVKFVDAVDALVQQSGLSREVSEIIGVEACKGLAETLTDSILQYKFRPLQQHPVVFGRDEIHAIVKQVIGESI